MTNLSSQQISLASSDYDLRITNLARFIYKKLPIKKGHLIDIGAGNGLLLKFFKDRGFEVEGIELEADQVHAMQQDFKLKGVAIRQGDIMSLKGKDKYDVVIASDVIEHIQDDHKALVNLFSFVAPGGYLVITVPAHSYLFGKRDIAWGHHRRYDKKVLVSKAKMLENSGVIGVFYWNLIAYFAYWYYETVLRQPIKENFRYEMTLTSKIIRFILDIELRLEEFFGGVFLGLTLVTIVRKNKIV